MSYYMGDYYQGDYYQGDPFLGGLVALGAGFVGKKLLGKGVGAAGKALAKRGVAALGRPGTAKVIAAGAGGGLLGRFGRGTPTIAPRGFGPDLPVPGIKGKLQRFFPGGATGFYRRRRMNVTNVKALRRAIRRAEGFRKLAMRVLSFSKGKSYGGRVVKFKQARRARA